MTAVSEKARVVAGVDGSELSEHVVRWAAYLAGVTGASLEIVTAWPSLAEAVSDGAGAGAEHVWDPGRDAREKTAEILSKVLSGVAADISAVRQTIMPGKPAKVLIEASEGAHMLVVGRRGHGGFRGLLVGSVSAICSEHAHCPVLVVHENTPFPELAVTQSG